MTIDLSRRNALTLAAAAACSTTFLPKARAMDAVTPPPGPDPIFKISLAEWSLHRALFAKELDHLDFPKTAKETFGIDAVELVNAFFKDKAGDHAYLAEYRRRAADHGVRTLLIMCDGEGALGDADEAKRTTAVENHYKWADAAKLLGCHSIRVNAQSSGEKGEQARLAADGLSRLTDYASKMDLNVIVENHGGWSSNGQWLADVMKRVNNPRCGTLPDFGNFQNAEGGPYDRYDGTRDLMPFAKAVSAKSHQFDAEGNETKSDYRRLMKIVLDAGYHGYVGVEYEGDKHSETEGVKLTKALLERVRGEMG